MTMAQHSAPSIKSLTSKLKDVDVPKAKLLRRILKADREALLGIHAEIGPLGLDAHEARYSCLTSELRAELLDCVLGTYGAEELFNTSEGLQNHPEDPQGKDSVGEYLNAGDTYAPTLINTGKGWRIGCMGDIAERYCY
jgi:hypothetical protein